MAWFNRTKKSTVVLPELEKYYDAERRERSGMAWIMALVSIAGVALILIGMVFGGRWIYRHTRGNNPTTVAVVQEDNTGSSTEENTKVTTENTPESTPLTTPTSDTTPKVTTPAPATKPTTPATTASNGTKELVNTGPEELIPAFITATATGILAYRRKLVKKS